jgi:hypothetical protein
VRWLAIFVWIMLACGPSGPAPAREHDADDAQNGTAIEVHVGDRVRVMLDSTAWTFDGSTDPEVLQQVGAQQTSPAPPSACVAGGGCGTSTADFRALKGGSATIHASRVSCGEALACVGAEGTYALTVLVAS